MIGNYQQNFDQNCVKRKSEQDLDEYEDIFDQTCSQKRHVREVAVRHFPTVFTPIFQNLDHNPSLFSVQNIDDYIKNICQSINSPKMYDHSSILQKMRDIAQSQEAYMKENVNQEENNLKNEKNQGNATQKKLTKKIQNKQNLQKKNSMQAEAMDEQCDSEQLDTPKVIKSGSFSSQSSSSNTIVMDEKQYTVKELEKTSLENLDNLDTQSIDQEKQKRVRKPRKGKKSSETGKSQKSEVTVNQFNSTDDIDESSSCEETNSEEQIKKDINVEQLFNDSTYIFGQNEYQNVKKKSVFGDEISFEFLNLPETINNYDFDNLEAY